MLSLNPGRPPAPRRLAQDRDNLIGVLLVQHVHVDHVVRVSSDRLASVVMAPFWKVWTVPSPSRSVIVRRLTDSIVPPIPLTTAESPR